MPTIAAPRRASWLTRLFSRRPPDPRIAESHQLTASDIERIERAHGIHRVDERGNRKGKGKATLPLRMGRDAGILDPNKLFSSVVLYGTPTEPGLLKQIRDSDDTVSPAADSRREMLESLDYAIVPREHLRSDPEAIACARDVGEVMQTMTTMTLGYFVASTYDHYATQGGALYEMVIEDGGLSLDFIRRGTVAYWIPDETGRQWESVAVYTRGGITEIPREKCAYFARNPVPGQFDGHSAFRCVVGASTTTHELYTQLFGSLNWSRGFLHAHDVGGENAAPMTDEDAEEIHAFLTDIASGRPRDAILTSAAVKFEIISSQIPALQAFAPLAQHQSEVKNRAALNSLANIGLRGVGSRSLGEVVLSDSQRRLQQHLTSFLNTLSGDNQPNGTLMATLAQLLGYSPDVAPRIVVDWSTAAETASLDHIKVVMDLVDRRMLAQTPELRTHIATQMGMPDQVIRQQAATDDAQADAATMSVGAIEAMVKIAQAALSGEDGAPPLPAASALEMLVSVGVPREQAAAIIRSIAESLP